MILGIINSTVVCSSVNCPIIQPNICRKRSKERNCRKGIKSLMSTRSGCSFLIRLTRSSIARDAITSEWPCWGVVAGIPYQFYMALLLGLFKIQNLQKPPVSSSLEAFQETKTWLFLQGQRPSEEIAYLLDLSHWRHAHSTYKTRPGTYHPRICRLYRCPIGFWGRKSKLPRTCLLISKKNCCIYNAGIQHCFQHCLKRAY